MTDFEEQVALAFLHKILDNEGLMGSDSDDEEIIGNAKEIANAVSIFTTAFVCKHKGEPYWPNPNTRAYPSLAPQDLK